MSLKLILKKSFKKNSVQRSHHKFPLKESTFRDNDLIEGIILMMNKEQFLGPVNLGNPLEITVKQLAEEIIKLTSSSSKLVFNDLPVDDPKQRCPNINIARKKLEWSPKVEREEGLTKTINYFNSLILKRN